VDITDEEQADVVIVGSGAAGATAALGGARFGHRTLVITKSQLGAGSTTWAQGGLAAVLDASQDSWSEHVADTLVAGAGLSDPRVVEQLVRRAPDAVEALIDLGATFDRDLSGNLALALEGGHHRSRIVHAGGDATGAEVQRTLDSALRAAGVEVRERCIALDVVLDAAGHVAGVVVADVDALGGLGAVTLVRTSVVVLATGGMGQLFAVTTNPAESTADGLALAWRCGAEIADVEFVQFHPTAFWQPGGHGQQLLVSEAVRGEGATLVDALGEPVMKGVHPLGDLAPRDVVATAIAMRMRVAPGGIGDHVFLDATALGPSLAERFPTIVAIPVAPAAHFACGGVRATLEGTTSVPGLFAIGEVADTGVHGANRLASNGVTEGLVAGRLLAERLGSALPAAATALLGSDAAPPTEAAGPSTRAVVTPAMSRWAGPLREHEGLSRAAETISTVLARDRLDKLATLADVEATNIATVAQRVVAGALERTESRGSHRRLDHPEPLDRWRGRIVQARDGDEARLRFEPMAAT
jgi:L-aspartate oxidase